MTDDSSSSAIDMSRKRVVLATTVIAGLFLVHVYTMATGADRWPFGPYEMFTGHSVQQQEFGAVSIVGLTAGPHSREIVLDDPNYASPLPVEHWQVRFQRGAFLVEHGQPRVIDMLCKDFLKIYERRRQSGAHQGPPLAALRVYRDMWRLDPWGRNIGRPDRHTLIYQYPSGS